MRRSASTRSRRVRRSAAITAVGVLVAAAAGCGVSPSPPQDHGDGLKATASGDGVRSVPEPNDTVEPVGLVKLFLQAPVGGGETAIDQVQEFLTENALAHWQDPVNPENPQLTVIRIVNDPDLGAPVDRRTPVRVKYQIIGLLTDQGRVDEVSQPVTEEMTFWVVPAADDRRFLRIDEIDGAPPGLLLSDKALDEIYRIQPVYFWDAQYSQLVPDLRYLPLTLGEELRAGRLVDWLLDGPSPWLATGTNYLPSGTRKESVVIRSDDDTVVVNLNAEVAPSPEELDRLVIQLRWSLNYGTANRAVELRIAGAVERASRDEQFRQYGRSWTCGTPLDGFDIVDGRVVPADGSDPPALLRAKQNADVVAAAVNRNATAAALVRVGNDGLRYLQMLRLGGVSDVHLPRSDDLTRPSWVPLPGAAAPREHVILVADGELYLVSAADGQLTLLATRVGPVTTASVSPDGRRVAFVAGGEAYVAPLILSGDRVTLGSNPRPILGGTVTATGVAWGSETWLYVGGTAGGAPAMWRVSSDGVVAYDQSGILLGLTVTDVVAGPVWPDNRIPAVIVYTPSGPYAFGTSTTETSLHTPFFGG